jgi:tRNA (guanine37-N1)-methyltransferase
LLSPQGRLFDQASANDMIQQHEHLILVCGHYEGVDERFIETCVDQELSIGDYVLNGGEIAALVVSDVLIRLIPGVIGSAESILEDSLEGGLLKYPQYTKPRDFQGKQPPEILFSGHHANIEKWRKEQAILRTEKKRPDLWQKYLKGN